MTWSEPALFCERLLSENFTYAVERLDVGDRIRPECAADRLLVDEHDRVDVIGVVQTIIRTDLLTQIPLGAGLAPGELPLECAEQHIVHQRALARSAHAGHHGQCS